MENTNITFSLLWNLDVASLFFGNDSRKETIREDEELTRKMESERGNDQLI